ncbi:MAG TPA: DUF1385 domain-containing protein [Tissierellaceae bacterium]|nr:DUF1385 domain-containing protein [Tissierellaceae bacterium]
MEKEEARINPKHKTSIGGQALIEGVMMRGPKSIATAVRKPDGEIVIKEEKLNTLAMRNKYFRLPFIRGVVGIVESLKIGTKELMYSADFYEEEEAEDNKESWTEKIFKDKAQEVEMTFTVLLSVVIALVVFMILPNFLASLFGRVTDSPVVLNLIEGFIRVFIFFLYVIWISKLDDIRRVFEYHGAEHKSIHCYENELELSVENVKKFPILHARCGTSFLFMVMIVSIFVLSFFGWPNPLLRVVIRILMFPVIAGISYEINRIIGRSSSKLCYALSYPGLMVQKYATVREPDDEQIEVAIAALKAVIPESREEDKW